MAFAQNSISGLEFLGISSNASPGEMIAALYVYGVGFVALAAFIMFTIGGVMYIFSGDKDPGRAKEMMKNAFWGLVLALTSWLILYTINPELVKTWDPKLPKIQQSGSGQPNQPVVGTATRNQPCVPGSTNPSEVCAAGLDTCVTVLNISRCAR